MHRSGAVSLGSIASVTIRRFLSELGRRIRWFFTNWHEYDAPVGTKLALTMRNRTKALFSRTQCCGNHGQPGC
jgi:hypothetical protein